MKTIVLIFLILPFTVYPQGSIKYLLDVPEKSTTQHSSKLHNYNPLQVGNYWEYEQTDIDGSKHYFRRSVVKDTIVNSKKYFKKVDYRGYGAVINGAQTTVHYFNWERNDTFKKASYMLDVEDLNNNGKTDDELLLDSLEIPKNPYPRVFLSYRYTWKNAYVYSSPAYVRFPYSQDSLWTIVFGDTVMTRHIEYSEKFMDEIIADKYGVIYTFNEGPPLYLTGAVIDGKQYGTIVNVENDRIKIPNDIILYNNYPNPFNPTTVIGYKLPVTGYVTLRVLNLLGREIVTLVNKEELAGKHEVKFDGSGLASGIYFYQLITGKTTNTMKMILQK